MDFDLFAAGRAIMESFTDGLTHAWEATKEFVSGIGDWIREHKGPISYDRKLLIPAGKAIMGGLNESLQASFKSVQKQLSQWLIKLRIHSHLTMLFQILALLVQN